MTGEASEVAECKANILKLSIYLYTNSEQLENEIEKCHLR